MLRVYCAGPYSGDVDANCARAIDVGEEVRRAGFLPFVPHLYRAWDARHAGPYQQWMALCFEEVRRSDALYLYAPSPGANQEQAHAESIGLPVFFSIDALIAWRDEPAPDPCAEHRMRLRIAEGAFRHGMDDPMLLGDLRAALRLAQRQARGEPVRVAR